MRRHNLKYKRNRDIDEVTAMRIRQYETLTGQPVELPVPVEKIIEQILDLTFDWIEIDEQPGEQILGGLIPDERRIVLNARHTELFQEKPGLERSTIGHEAGHWDIDIDRTSLNHPALAGLNMAGAVIKRQAADGRLLVEVLNRAVYDEKYYSLYKQLTQGTDSPEVSSAVDRYQSSLLMPRWLMFDAAERCDVTSWPQLYELAELAQVNISNLVVRLTRLDLIYIPEGSRDLYAGRDAFTGQKHLF